MSWTMWHNYGYGMDVAPVDIGKFVDFCKAHSDTLKTYGMIDALKDIIYECGADLTYEDVIGVTDNGTIGEVIAFVIWKETDVRFVSPGMDDEGNDYVMFMPCYPWDTSKAEKEIHSLADLFNVLKPYEEELDLIHDPDEIDLIYSG